MPTLHEVVVETGFHIEEYDSTLRYLRKLLVSQGMSFTDAHKWGYKILGDENLHIQDNLSFSNYINLLLQEGFTLSDSATPSKIIRLVFEDNLNLDDSVSNTIDFFNAVNEKMNVNAFANILKFQNGEYVLEDTLDCWVVNYETNAFTRYSNYNFNSFVKLNEKYYGLNEVGLFLLDSEDTDDGKNINAKIKTGKLDLGGGLKTYVRDMFLYSRNDSEIYLKVITDNTIETYKLLNPTDNITNNRINLSGTKAFNWQFELSTDGNFDLENIKLNRIITSRLS